MIRRMREFALPIAGTIDSDHPDHVEPHRPRAADADGDPASRTSMVDSVLTEHVDEQEKDVKKIGPRPVLFESRKLAQMGGRPPGWMEH